MKTCYICYRPNSAHPRPNQLAICSPCAKAWKIELLVHLQPEPEPAEHTPEMAQPVTDMDGNTYSDAELEDLLNKAFGPYP